MLNFFGLPFVDGSSKAIFDKRSICKSFSFMTLDNVCGITNLLQDLKDAGLKLKDLKTEQSTLEKIFVNLVREKNEN
ncbi:hypothetical protein OAX99_01495 [Candidatus Pelagibacter sp.]|nr:hypothetical protein [Candidatus Pelagibacter sp.]